MSGPQDCNPLFGAVHSSNHLLSFNSLFRNNSRCHCLLPSTPKGTGLAPWSFGLGFSWILDLSGLDLALADRTVEDAVPPVFPRSLKLVVSFIGGEASRSGISLHTQRGGEREDLAPPLQQG